MSFSVSFDPVADWEAALPGGAFASEPQLRKVIAEGPQRALKLLSLYCPVASLEAGIALFLQETASASAALAEQLVRAVIAADHYNARIPCPKAGSFRWRTKEWRTYVEQRIEATAPTWSKALADWTVWRRIPENWIPRELVFAGIARRLGEAGYGGLQIEGELYSPAPGGDPGLRRRCESDRASLAECCELRATAVVLYDESGPAAMVVDRMQLCKALSARGLASGPEPVTPPTGWWVKVMRITGTGDFWWRVVRWTRKGG